METQVSTTQMQPITMVAMPQTEWQKICQKLEELASLITSRNADELNSEWLESSTARKQLGVSQKTWQTYRDKRIIPFSQFGRKVYVRRADLEAFMQSHYIKAIA